MSCSAETERRMRAAENADHPKPDPTKPLLFALFSLVRQGDEAYVVFTRNQRRRVYGCRKITGKPGHYRQAKELTFFQEIELRAVQPEDSRPAEAASQVSPGGE